MLTKSVRKNGRDYVMVARGDFDRLVERAASAALPPLPKPNADGNYPALAYLRVTIARDIIRERAASGLTQRELAKQAGIRVETLCRIETGKHTASLPTIERLDRALRLAMSKKKAGKGR